MKAGFFPAARSGAAFAAAAVKGRVALEASWSKPRFAVKEQEQSRHVAPAAVAAWTGAVVLPVAQKEELAAVLVLAPHFARSQAPKVPFVPAAAGMGRVAPVGESRGRAGLLAPVVGLAAWPECAVLAVAVLGLVAAVGAWSSRGALPAVERCARKSSRPGLELTARSVTSCAQLPVGVVRAAVRAWTARWNRGGELAAPPAV